MEKHFKYQFILAIFLMLAIGCMSIYFLNNVQVTTSKMYEHPYTVSNKLKEIRVSVHQIHLDSLSISDINFREIGRKDSLNRESLRIITAQYLGDPNDVKKLANLYEQWLDERLNESKLNDNEERMLFDQLLIAVGVLADYADNKAAELYNNAALDTQQYGLYIGFGLFIATILSIVLLLRTLTALRTMIDDREQYLHLIDQNVMMASLSEEGRVSEISSELSRFLVNDRDDLEGKQFNDIFPSNDDQFKTLWRQIRTGTSWHGNIQVTTGDDAKWLDVDILPIQDSHYNYSGFRFLAHDISGQKSLEQVSITDSLTGLLNRRTLDDTIEQASKLSNRNKMPLTVGIFDVDYFKQYNDTYGHMAGDKVLTRLASLVSKMLSRPDDFVFRIGGEEFCIIFNAKSAEQSKDYLDKIREAVKGLHIKHENSAIDEYVTISIGALFLDGSNVVESKVLFSEADDNLYRAKEKRNQTFQTEYGTGMS